MRAIAINVKNLFMILFLYYLRSFAVLAWSLPRLSLEKADEVLRIFKAEVPADLRNAEGFINK